MSSEKVNGISSAAVEAKTGKTWPRWRAALDAAGARAMSHQEIVAHLAQKHRLGPWWQQMVTVGYEQMTGRRVKHQTTAGFQISRSKTIQALPEAVFAAWKDSRKRRGWLQDGSCTIRTAIVPRSLRMTWDGGSSSVEVGFTDKGTGKTQVVVNHTKLADAAAAQRMRTYWAAQLERLEAYLQA
jgi:uncharacterized protein YndB with AHSA1/START domain